MISAISTALSGFQAATARLDVSANNIANEFSTSTSTNGTESNTPYTPQQLVQSSEPNGGVTTGIVPVSPATVGVNEPGSTTADSNGITQLPNVDPAQQLVNANIATYDAKANLTVLKAQNNLFQSVLNIVS